MPAQAKAPSPRPHLNRAVMARVASTAAPSPNLPIEVAYLQTKHSVEGE